MTANPSAPPSDEPLLDDDLNRTKAYRSPSAISVNVAAKTDVGQIREHNEDDLLVANLTTRVRDLDSISTDMFNLEGQGALFAVCDGMGGAAAGEIASNMAVNILFERMTETITDAPSTRDELARRLVRSIETAGMRIFQEARADRSRRGMGTTVTAAALMDDHLFLGQVGDSRGYILRNGKLTQVTRDQSLVNQLIEAGQLTEEEAETFEHNNIILQALGTADSVQVDLTVVKLKRDDVLLLCSDGLSGMLRAEDIRFALSNNPIPREACRVLIDRANAAGGHDNVTVVVAQFSGSALDAVTDEDEPLKYTKYALPEETPSERDAKRPMNLIPKTLPPPDLFSRPASRQSGAGTEPYPADSYATSNGPNSRRDEDERVIVPGTHIPAWAVAMLVLLVIAILAGGAVVLVR